MTPSFDNAELLLNSVNETKKQLEGYEGKLSKAIRRSGPAGIAPIDLSKPVVRGSKARQSIDETAAEIARLTIVIQKIRDDVGDILTTVARLEKRERCIIEMWYFQRLSKDEIAKRLYYSDRKPVYALKKRAIEHFIQIFPW